MPHHPQDRPSSRRADVLRRALGTARVVLSVLLLLSLVHEVPSIAFADEPPAPTDQPGLSYEQHIAPLLNARCVECHRRQKLSGKLDLSSPRGIARGSESGAIIVPGKPDESLVWELVSSDVMPPDPHDPLSVAEKATLQRWIAEGAKGLTVSASGTLVHWSFLPPRKAEVPSVKQPERIQNPIDSFIEARLEQQGLTLSLEADRTTLVRRVAFDLTGLPPSPEEIAAFLVDDQPGAYERMVDRYLASPRYGERWAKHWLDAAGYSDSNGYFHADSDRPLAYRYRDYVIRSLNADKPFDQFLTEQLAGDELVGYEPGGDVTPEMLDKLIATHFLRNSQDGSGESDGNDDEVLIDRFTVLEGTVEIIGSALLGLTVQCAKCHAHKFEPFTQEEYFGLQAIFWPAYNPDEWRKPNERVLEVGTRAEREAHAAATANADEQLARLKKSMDDAAAPLVEQIIVERINEIAEPSRSKLLAAWRAPEMERDDSAKALIKVYEKALAPPADEELLKRFPELAALREGLSARIKEVKSSRPAPLEKIAVLTETCSTPPEHHLRVRGQYRELGPVVAPCAPTSLSSESSPMAVDAAGALPYRSGRRTAFARWLTDQNNPRLTRVTVNRLWQQHFGRGLVLTPENFGLAGAEPTHPELLDWLSRELIESGWSLKHLHRLMVTSAVYRQTGALHAQAFEIDPENALWWRYPVRRLDAEALRDATLMLSGELDVQMEGPYVPTKRGEDGSVSVEEKTAGAHRRSIYLQQRRTQALSFLELFDAPLVVTNCTRRATSTIPLQSLALLNSEFTVRRSEAFAARLLAPVGEDDRARIDRAMLLALGRVPRDEERAAAEKFLAAQTELYRADPESKQTADEITRHVWSDFCQGLLASNAFLYVE